LKSACHQPHGVAIGDPFDVPVATWFNQDDVGDVFIVSVNPAQWPFVIALTSWLAR
jgi:hypothetical protein